MPGFSAIRTRECQRLRRVRRKRRMAAARAWRGGGLEGYGPDGMSLPMPTSLVVGRKAPAFTLPDQDGQKVKLSDFKGRWVVLYFYPNDDTPGCTTEACEFTAGIKGFESIDATVLGCSANSAESHRKFIAKYKLKG